MSTVIQQKPMTYYYLVNDKVTIVSNKIYKYKKNITLTKEID